MSQTGCHSSCPENEALTALVCHLSLSVDWENRPESRKHAYSNILKFLPPKNENLQKKKSVNFHISGQNIDCRYSLEPTRRGGSNEYTQSMLLSRNKKNIVYPCKAQCYYIKVGFNGVKII